MTAAKAQNVQREDLGLRKRTTGQGSNIDMAAIAYSVSVDRLFGWRKIRCKNLELVEWFYCTDIWDRTSGDKVVLHDNI